eukprot:snap_masked-scaffold_33-processed-gene-2.37-mRNA-1 protein AED:0.20 eAED:1.00 QI:0/-1/0/1/-1/1/1/0/363
MRKEKTERPRTVVLKKSCSRCVTLKRKCDSLKPSCTRCRKRGSICSYEVASKRGPKTTRGLILGTKRAKFSIEEQSILSSLFFPDISKEDRLANIFTRINASKNWVFNYIDTSADILTKYYKEYVLSPGQKTDVLLSASFLSIVSLFLVEEGVHFIVFEDMFFKFKAAMKKYRINMSDVSRLLTKDAHLIGNDYIQNRREKFLSYENKHLYPLPFRLPEHKAFYSMFVERPEGSQNLANPHFEINTQFEKYFGFGLEVIISALSNSIQSCLTFGSSILTLLTNEESIHHFLKANEFRFGMMKLTEGTETPQPWEINYPCSIILNLETGDGEWKPFQINSLSRQFVCIKECFFESRFYFTPCEI